MLNINYFHVLTINQFKCLLCTQRLLSLTQSCQVKYKQQTSLKQSYQILGLSEDCEDEALRLAFVYLAKQYHPDSGSTAANSTKFSEIESAYRTIQRQRNEEKERIYNLPDVEEFDIKHTAPQHRHFLTYDTGHGTPSERQKRYTVERAQKAVDNLMEHRMNKIQAAERNTLIEKDKTRARNIKTKYGVDRLVEDLIQEAMNKGEFKDLPGTGKPLKDRTSYQNPYVDFVTHKMNEILINIGFTPEWIQLSKEIREETEKLKNDLLDARDDIGKLPLTNDDDERWQNILTKSQEIVATINKKINKFNLLVPILQKQMVQINLNHLSEDVLKRTPRPKKLRQAQNQSNALSDANTTSLLDFILTSFERKKS